MTDRNAANVGSFTLFASGCNDDEADSSCSIIDLTSIGDVDGQTKGRVGGGIRTCPRPAKSMMCRTDNGRR